MMDNHIKHILSMRASVVKNYGLPDVDSSLLTTGVVRLFESHRAQQEAITPHSHKFDFTCLVLEGSVRNVLWVPDDAGDEFTVSQMDYLGAIGKYQKLDNTCTARFSPVSQNYGKGCWYSMKSNEIHSIYFSKGCKVLFFEGPKLTDRTVILEPCRDGKTLPTFQVRDWMFQKEKSNAN